MKNWRNWNKFFNGLILTLGLTTKSNWTKFSKQIWIGCHLENEECKIKFTQFNSIQFNSSIRAFYFIFDILIFRAKRCLSERFSNWASFQKSYVYYKICFRCTISLSFILQKKKNEKNSLKHIKKFINFSLYEKYCFHIRTWKISSISKHE